VKAGAFFTRFARCLRRHLRSRGLQRALERNARAAADLDAAVREVLQK